MYAVLEDNTKLDIRFKAKCMNNFKYNQCYEGLNS